MRFSHSTPQKHLLAVESRKHILGPLGRLSAILSDGLDRILPRDAHKTCSGRLEVSITPLWTEDGALNNWRVNTFHSRKDLIDCVLASCYIPGFQERPAFYRGNLCLDGGFWYNYPHDHVSKNVLVVNHRTGMGHISPKAAFQTWHKIFPPPADVLNDIYIQGTEDAAQWLAMRAAR